MKDSHAKIATLALLAAFAACSGGGLSQSQLEQCGRESASCGDGPQFVISALRPSYPDSKGRVEGFNIDGKVSDANSRDGCKVEDFTNAAGAPGIDNRLTNLLSQTTPQIQEYVPAVIQSTIGTGGLLFIFELVGVDDLANDDQIGIVIRRSTDIPLLGTDGMVLDGQTFWLAFDHFAGATTAARIEDGRVKAGPFSWNLLTRFFAVDIRFTFENFYVDAELAPDGRSLTGLVGGSIPIVDILGIADAIDNFGGDASVPFIRALVPPLADVRSPETDECDSLSFAAFATGEIAYLNPTIRTQDALEAETGDQLFVQLGCTQCHAVSRVPGAQGTTGPSLDGLRERANSASGQQTGRDFVVQSLNNPNFYIPSGYDPDIMPDDTQQRLTLEQYDVLVDWLMTL